ncbi:MAG: 16S rRNA (cytosine(1402)-N(4))-methyltransferase RsmH [Planctomycetota bacterium]|nr:MAG: 16S rRNA (cytosine(1402)-N(4))-methyltransferase RsmH [Planctomycetota bacterium]
MSESPHVPVLADEVEHWLGPAIERGGTVIDATLGAGGHARRLLARMPPGSRYVGIDRDAQILEHARARLAPWRESHEIVLLHTAFERLGEIAARHAPGGAAGILLDVGVSSLQLDDPARGFTFRAAGPLDMRMDPSTGESAAELLARLDERELADLLYHYGGERRSRRIAAAIVEARRRAPLTRTDELADIIVRAVGRRYERGRIHPATRTFQALRIAVNRELEQLERALEAVPEALAPGGRVVVISFHSLEDRRVKLAFREAKRAGRLTVLTKKPVRPGPAEIARNRRARSARLRAAERPEAGS